MKIKSLTNPIFCAIDTANFKNAVTLAEQLKGVIGGIKLGKEFFTANGPQGVKNLREIGHKIFLDLKFHDIPNTVKGAVCAANELNCFMLTIHSSGGPEMVVAASKTKSKKHSALIIAVTVLTSLDNNDLELVGQDKVNEQVIRLGKLAIANGADGLVASAMEVPVLRKVLGSDCLFVVPGVRPLWVNPDDQKRVTTPSRAIELGADVLVIGRPITQAKNPRDAAIRISDEILTK